MMKLFDVVRTGKYMPWEFALRCPDLLISMVGNRISFRVEEEEDPIHPDNLEGNFLDLMQGHCESNNSGVWTYTAENCYYDEDGGIVDDKDNTTTIKGSQTTIVAYFAEAQDADKFANNFLVYYKLSN